MNYKKRYYILFLLLVTFVSSYAQEFKVTGVVKDLDGEPLPGVNVVEVDINNRYLKGTITNLDGYFEFVVKSQTNRLSFSFIGFKDQVVPIDKSNYTITLIEDVTEIEGVNIVANIVDDTELLPIAKENLSSATQSLKMDALNEVPSVSIGDAIQGRLAGVDVAMMGGDPGSGTRLTIRGIGSLNGNTSPLVVLDGMVFPTSFNEDFDFQTATYDDFGALLSISPENIEEISVLKDASATAIYGSRGANGVLVIKTKRGKSGKTIFGYNMQYKLKTEPNPIPMLSGNDYVGLVSEAIWNSYLHSEGKNDSYLSLLENYPEINGDKNYRYYDEYNVNTDWLGEIVRDFQSSHNHDLSMSGGGSKARYRITLGMLNENGNTTSTSFNRFNNRINLDYDVSDRIKFYTDFSFNSSERNGPYFEEGDHPNVRMMALRRMPNMSPYLLDEQGNRTNDYFQLRYDWQGTGGIDWYNPVAMNNESLYQTKLTRLRSVFRVKYRISERLNYHFNVALDKSEQTIKKYAPQVAYGSLLTNAISNKVSETTQENFALETEQRIQYTHLFNEGTALNAMIRFNTNLTSVDQYTPTIRSIPSADAKDVANNGVVQSFKNETNENRLASLSSTIHYVYRNRYIIQGTYRYDGTSKIGANERWSQYPSIGIGWRIDQENFLGAATWLDNLKLDAAYGVIGRSPTQSYSHYGAYSGNGAYMDKNAIQPTRVTLSNLKNERIEDFNLGFNLSAFNYRVDLSVQYYNRTTRNLLMKDATIPTVTGFSKLQWYNGGDIRNSGFEVFGSVVPIKKNNFQFRIAYNFAYNKNEILSKPDNVKLLNYTYGNGKFASNQLVGNPLYGIYGYRSLGVYSTTEDTYAKDANGNDILDINGQRVIMTSKYNQEFKAGDARYEDINSDGVIDENDIVFLGGTQPKYTGGFTPTFTYKNWSLKTHFAYRLDFYIKNMTRIKTEDMYGKSNQSTAVLHRWRNEGDVTDVPRALYNRGYNTLGSDRFVEKGDYINFSQLTLSYRFTPEFLKRIHFKSCSMYVTGQNLVTWTKYSGQDPKTVSGVGEDNSYSPLPQTYTLGLNLQF
ncbi:MAG: SusC/RagA family TonB-linked outer membrane protein [Carboxylicivirga sp.]|jgi:TonB-linked SusC/RagA family outer membrane protein|nr:SusC/RagA family TonB-linked outer membrane protein [Carboxylicivirga sp.]